MSKIVVQKYGGTSVGDLDRIRKVASRVARAVEAGDKVAVTVSAMGRTTDALVSLAKEITARPDRRELDMLMATGEQQSIALLTMALHTLGVRARSFTGQQAGFLTDSASGGARILEVNPERLLAALEHDDVVVIAGFQGVDATGMITTLGRGGSDTTAVAVAAALGARECEIYTDTEGVYTTDPHLVPRASKLERIDYDEMLELASLGAKVLHPRSVWYARRYGVTIHVRSSFSYNPGTLVARFDKEAGVKTDRPVTGVALDRNHARIDLLGVPDTPGVAAKVFGALGAAGISADTIIQGVPGDGSRQQMAFTVNQDVVEDALEAVRPVLAEIGGEVRADRDIAKLSVVGIAVGSTPGVAATMFRAVAEVGANIEMIATSEVRISVVIEAAKAVEALHAVHRAFGLERDPDVLA
ncbi:aspartate kinase [Truepera radiovictrix]|uniref:Aspartokinase n=1 Tax=Truepera radiovictrix (strain DSM 17093 / CIP 108686 / LMG 22925 / RQ-24) TaxID=649638 RepID=D7CUW5_TRURR|nr:aspartate kinase [Truepera radiovictrix]ADI14106.1 aspartate kinase [Truepera radiovictrix DSM 17093]WMT57332.1 aspartate kinase [Truepera radiovictrix]